MAVLSTGPIANDPVSGVRTIQTVIIKIVNRDSINFSSVHIQGYKLNSFRTLYVLEEISIAPNEVITRNFGADFDAYEFVFTTDGSAEISTEISVWGRNESGVIIDVQRVVAEEQLET